MVVSLGSSIQIKSNKTYIGFIHQRKRMNAHFYFTPIINWGKYREESGRLMMPVSVRLNHVASDGYLVAKVFMIMEDEIQKLCGE